MKKNYFILTKVFILYFLLGFPLFYFVYKYGDPEDIAHDFFQYYRLYSYWDWSNVNSPFNMRLVSSFLVYLFNKLNLSYETKIIFDKWAAYGFSKQVFFNAVFFNFLCVVSTATFIFRMCYTQNKKFLLSLLGGAIYLLGFGTIFYELMPLTDAFSVLLFAISFNLYRKKSLFIIPILAFTILQREYILIVWVLISFLDYFKFRNKFYLGICIQSVIFLLIHMILRRTIFNTNSATAQVSPESWIDSIKQLQIPLVTYFRQIVLTLNIFILYTGVIIYKRIKRQNYNSWLFTVFLLLLVQNIIVCYIANAGNNAGRYFYMLAPMLIFHLIEETQIFFNQDSENIIQK